MKNYKRICVKWKKPSFILKMMRTFSYRHHDYKELSITNDLSSLSIIDILQSLNVDTDKTLQGKAILK